MSEGVLEKAHSLEELDRVVVRSVLPSMTAGDHATASKRLVVFSDDIDATCQICLFHPPELAKDCGIFVAGFGREGIPKIAEARGVGHEAAVEWILDLYEATHVMLVRDPGNFHREVLDVAKRRKIPTLYYIDDNLIEIPECTGENIYRYFQDPARQQAMRDCVGETDLLCASTPPMAAQMAPLRRNGDIYTFPIYKSINMEGRCPAPVADDGQPFTIGYMASQSHIGDLIDIKEEIFEVLDTIPDARFELFGSIDFPEGFEAYEDRIYRHPRATSYQEFARVLHQIGWHVALAPLSPILYNDCKSNTKWVEYTLAGIPTVAADCVVYADVIAAGAALPANLGGWREAILALAGDQDKRVELLRAGERHLGSEHQPADHIAQIHEYLDLAASIAGKN